MDVVHSGFDGLRFTIEADIPPEFREALIEAKTRAVKTNAEAVIECCGVSLSVRRSGGMAFSAHTGEYGAEWYFLDPQNKPKNNPGITVDFRAFLLATGGLEDAKAHFYECLAAFGIRFVETQVKVSRADFAIDFLAPWFEPDRSCLVVPPNTRVCEYADSDTTETHSIGDRVSGLRAGAVANRQLCIYDKRAEVLETGKRGWLTIWNASRAAKGKSPLDLADRDQSQVWRFELRMGSKQLRHKWAMRGWADLETKAGDAFLHFCDKMRYCIPTADTNRSRWPEHELWRRVRDVVSRDLRDMRSFAEPQTVKEANRLEHKRMLDTQILGLMVSRAAAGGIEADAFEGFVKRHSRGLITLSRAHPAPIDERLAKAEGRYRFR